MKIAAILVVACGIAIPMLLIISQQARIMRLTVNCPDRMGDKSLVSTHLEINGAQIKKRCIYTRESQYGKAILMMSVGERLN